MGQDLTVKLCTLDSKSRVYQIEGKVINKIILLLFQWDESTLSRDLIRQIAKFNTAQSARFLSFISGYQNIYRTYSSPNSVLKLREYLSTQIQMTFSVVLINGGDFSNIDAPLEIEANSFEQLTTQVKSNFGLDQTGNINLEHFFLA